MDWIIYRGLRAKESRTPRANGFLDMSTIRISGVILLIFALSAVPASAAELSNRFIRLTLDGPAITEMRVDPLGKNPSAGMSFVKSLRPEFWQATPETGTEISGTTATIGPLEIWEYRGMASNVGIDQPDKLEPGHTLGQTIRVPKGGKLSSVQVRLPTWNSKTSGATISLFHEGKLVNSRRMEKVPDNSWQEIGADGSPGAGEYAVEIADPVGDIGWWSSKADTTSFGEALADGKPVAVDRAIQAHTYAYVGSGSMTIRLQGSRVHVEAEFTPTGAMQYKTFPWRWITTWTQDGYDCTPASGTVFSRFFTDNQRYMPIEQLKRRPNGGLRFDGFRWLEMDGTRDADFRLESGPMSLHWEMRPDEMHLRFDTAIKQTGGEPPLAPPQRRGMVTQPRSVFPSVAGGLGGVLLRTQFTLDVKAREDLVPHEFPHFACSDKALEADLNRLWWERAFTYGSPPNGSVEFSEWMAIMRSWYDGPQRRGEMAHLADYPMTDEGYVYVSADSLGWPLVPNRDTRHFDTNARFILACWRHYMWTGDLAFLRGQAERLRKAMAYQLDVLKGRDGLIVTPDFRTGRHEDLSNNYWDILPFGHLDAFANAVFYGSLEAMAQIEEALANAECGMRNAEYYRKLGHKSHESYDVTFWDEKAGRYVGCVDIDGVAHDYGFTFVNLEALYYGLGDAEKARRIYKWMETEPTSSGEADTYSKWIFAPRATTIHNPQWPATSTINHEPSTIPPWWTYWWAGTPFGDQCQDGGAILYSSFFDLMDRAKYRGADNAWQRFVEIIDRYRMPDRLCGGSPLYRGEVSQQENAGAVGVDYPFPESGMVPCYFLYGVMGIDATPEGLRIRPQLPKALTYAEVRDVHWRGMTLRIRVTNAKVEIDGFDAARKPFRRTFAVKPGGSAVLGDSLASR